MISDAAIVASSAGFRGGSPAAGVTFGPSGHMGADPAGVTPTTGGVNGTPGLALPPDVDAGPVPAPGPASRQASPGWWFCKDDGR